MTSYNFLCREERNAHEEELPWELDSMANKSHSKVAAANNADYRWLYPSVAGSFSEELYEGQKSFDSSLPSKTMRSEARWISAHNPESINRQSVNIEDPEIGGDVSCTWDVICAKGQPTLLDIDKLAEQFNILSGKWLMFLSPEKVDNLWERIAESTRAGTMGDSARVSTREEGDPVHVICVYNSDYRSEKEVMRIRDELRRLGVKARISYKPEIYTCCGIYVHNQWGIPASRYTST